MGAKLQQIKMIVEEVEENQQWKCKDDRVNADLLKSKKAAAYEQICAIVKK